MLDEQLQQMDRELSVNPQYVQRVCSGSLKVPLAGVLFVAPRNPQRCNLIIMKGIHSTLILALVNLVLKSYQKRIIFMTCIY